MKMKSHLTKMFLKHNLEAFMELDPEIKVDALI